jgi:small ligand-binding sensory domain FIST
MHGPVRLRSVVSQGCRPIGRPLLITKAQRNMLQELSGKPALARFSELYPTLTPQEQELVRGGLHVGRVINEYQDRFGRGDFLVRNVVGADRDSGTLVLGDFVRVGQTVQFHVRDAESADEDLRELLSAAHHSETARPAGALLFTCNGRGTRLFDAPHHDAACIAKVWPELPVAGFFAQGEIGPIGGRNFLHGFTASMLLVEPAEAPSRIQL